MQVVDVVKNIDIKRSARTMQLEGSFDLPKTDSISQEWKAEIPDIGDDWNIGLLVGPSGCGKSVILNEYFKQYIKENEWSDKAVIDDFPAEMPIRDIIAILNSVGFSSPPSWLKPFKILSNGERFRVDMARSMADSNDLFAVDEFTSVVDRTVAKIGSTAIAKTIRNANKRFIAASCHYDIIDWLQPDWIFEPHKLELNWRLLQQRPKLNLKIIRSDHTAWRYFSRYHYLTHEINKGCRLYVALLDYEPIAMVAFLPFPHHILKNVWRGHRLVCLPDYQGIGIGNMLSCFAGALCRGLNYRYRIRISHPAVINKIIKSDKWHIVDRPKIGSISIGKTLTPKKDKKHRHHNVLTRMVYSSEYIGPELDRKQAIKMWNCTKIRL